MKIHLRGLYLTETPFEDLTDFLFEGMLFNSTSD
jgi:hypothetical protein